MAYSQIPDGNQYDPPTMTGDFNSQKPPAELDMQLLTGVLRCISIFPGENVRCLGVIQLLKHLQSKI
jgi:hypothetical protein